MHVIPVMDLKGGVVVHARCGVRSEYAPIKSVLHPSSDPMSIMYAFKKFGFTELYIADIDAIEGRAPNLGAIRSIVRRSSMKIMVDAGVKDTKSVETLLRAHVSSVILATESIPSPSFVSDCVRLHGEKIVGSLDLRDETVLARSSEVSLMSPLEAAKMFEDAGIRSLIVVDLSRVGTSSGPPIKLLKNLVSRLSIPIIAGGGVRNIEDLKLLREIGVAGALVATALHTGEITPKKLQEFLTVPA
ncbi:MAG: HisA/HisF-related TIM barrel protein [Candidatus Jordarchaeales archaeon]